MVVKVTLAEDLLSVVTVVGVLGPVSNVVLALGDLAVAYGTEGLGVDVGAVALGGEASLVGLEVVGGLLGRGRSGGCVASRLGSSSASAGGGKGRRRRVVVELRGVGARARLGRRVGRVDGVVVASELVRGTGANRVVPAGATAGAGAESLLDTVHDW